jgi:hypothetical protein
MMTELTRRGSSVPTAATRIATGGIALSVGLGLVGVIAVRSAADERSARLVAQPNAQTAGSLTTSDASAAIAAERRRSASQLAVLRREYQRSLQRIATDYQQKLVAAVGPADVIYEDVPVYTESGSDQGSSGGDSSSGWSSGGSSGGGSASGGYSAAGSGGSSGGSAGGGGASSGSGTAPAAPAAPAVSGGS